ncbi:MAG TPA: sugar-binding domain-containing protein, partial [Dehalococcoidia bacterium]|nr:sugar-binding domain-containing protein [Dehalococcoidia bacterium]
LGFGPASASPLAEAVKAAAKRRGAARRSEIPPRDAVASVGCLFFDAEGRPCASSLDRRTVGISHDQLKAVPVRVGLAAGAKKVDATLALARGGIVNTLIIDAPLAQRLFDATGRK